MCTVSYLPISSKEGPFIFTSNRDEAPDRSSYDLCLREWAGQTLLYPQDVGAGGTWIAISDQDRLICILNGAFQKHQRQLPYRRSRGLMALDYFFFADVLTFSKYYVFLNIEPFTAIIWEQAMLWELRWDGQQLHQKELAIDVAHLWSSATLYDADVRQTRENWFSDWQKETPHPKLADAWHFHTETGKDDPSNAVVMNRNNRVRTVSITQIQRHSTAWKMEYRELLSNRSHEQSLALSQNLLP